MKDKELTKEGAIAGMQEMRRAFVDMRAFVGRLKIALNPNDPDKHDYNDILGEVEHLRHIRDYLQYLLEQPGESCITLPPFPPWHPAFGRKKELKEWMEEG